jgi:hypothetical protein
MIVFNELVIARNAVAATTRQQAYAGDILWEKVGKKMASFLLANRLKIRSNKIL